MDCLLNASTIINGGIGVQLSEVCISEHRVDAVEDVQAGGFDALWSHFVTTLSCKTKVTQVNWSEIMEIVLNRKNR